MKDEPNKITTTLKVVITGEFYDDEASEETLRYCAEQDLGDAGFDVDVELLKEQEPKPVIQDRQCEVEPNVWERKGFCPKCHQIVLWRVNRLFCGFCGQAVKWDADD